MDMDEARIDADLGKLLQHIKEGQQNMSDQPGLCFTHSLTHLTRIHILNKCMKEKILSNME